MCRKSNCFYYFSPQSYTYEDFIQGLRPVISNNNQTSASNSLKFEWKDGIFKQIADRARNDEHNNYVIIIDEINRANISRVLGELITLLEEDKRCKLWTVSLPSGDKFYVPKNLYIVGTMNTADKSISNIDVALRRRFNFIEEPVDPEKVNNETLRKVLEKINDQLIKLQKSTDLLIGQAYFINKNIDDLPNILNDKVIPLLYEYFDDDNDVKKKVKGIIDEVVKIDNVGCKVVDNLYGRIKVEKNN